MCVRRIPPEMHGESSGGAPSAEVKSSMPGMHARMYACMPNCEEAGRLASIRLNLRLTYESPGLHSFHSSSRALVRRSTPARAGFISGPCCVSERAAVVQVPACRHFCVVSGGLTVANLLLYAITKHWQPTLFTSAKFVCGIDRCVWTR